MKEVNLTKRALLLMVVAVALLAGCSSSNVDKSIAQIEKAIKKVEKNKANITENDWQAFVSEIQTPYEVLDKALKEDKVGALKKIKILAVTTKLMVVVGEAGFSSKEGFETLMKASKEKQSSENK